MRNTVPEIWLYSYSLFIYLGIYNQVMSIKTLREKFEALYGYKVLLLPVKTLIAKIIISIQ